MNPDSTIAEAKTELYANLRDGGMTCPTCDQHAQEYARQISPQMAGALIALYKKGSWATWAEIVSVRADEAKLKYWGLVECANGVLWRVTDRGRLFVEGKLSVSQICWVYNGKPQSFEGPLVSISDALGKKLDLAELLAS